MFLKFFLVPELETLGMLWREETREKGDREGRGRGERQSRGQLRGWAGTVGAVMGWADTVGGSYGVSRHSGGSYGGEQVHHFSCTHLGQETLFGKKYLWRISAFYYSYKRSLLPSGYLIPPSSGVDQITHLRCALHSPAGIQGNYLQNCRMVLRSRLQLHLLEREWGRGGI